MFTFVVVFGVDLTTLVMAYDSKRPAVVDSCIAEVESRGEYSQFTGFTDHLGMACLVLLIKLAKLVSRIPWRPYL